MRRIFIASSIVAVALLALVVSDERNATSLFDPSGTIVSGEKFGVRVGDPLQSAVAALRKRGFSDLTVAVTDVCQGRHLQTDQTLFAYDKSWRSGYVCVGLAKGQVTAISWIYNFLQT